MCFSVCILQRPFQFLCQGTVTDWLQDKIQSRHFVSADSILCHSGYKDQSNMFIYLTELSRCFYAVNMRHFDIKEYNIINRTVFFQKVKPVRIYLGTDLQIFLHFIFINKLNKSLRVFPVVINNCNCSFPVHTHVLNSS